MDSGMDVSKIIFYKNYICENVIDLSNPSINDIFKFIKYKVEEKHLKECADGIRIDLNQLNDNLIYNIYKQVEYKTINENK
jgi:hypothetical protein